MSLKNSAAVLILGIGSTLAAHATPVLLTPGSSGVAPGTVATTNGTLLVGMGGSATPTPVAGDPLPFTANYGTQVYRGGTDALCPTCLTFAYQFSNSGKDSDPIERVTLASFAGFTTEVAYVPGSNFAPGTTSRGLNGAPVGFQWLNGGIPNGGMSDVFYVFTDAVNYQTGNITFQDGATVDAPAFMPAAVTPEPSSLILLGTGLLAAAGAARRKFSL